MMRIYCLRACNKPFWKDDIIEQENDKSCGSGYGICVWDECTACSGICGIYQYTKQKRETRIGELTGLLGLDSVINRKAGKLSGGWQRRLSIAMALISEPKILFLDEPTLGLDVIARSELWDIIVSLKGSVTIILTTHYMEEAEALSDRIAIMKDGKLLACDTAEGIKRATETDSVEKAFIRMIKGVVQ